MKLALDDRGQLSLEAAGCCLRAAVPMLNGTPLADWRVERMTAPAGPLRLTYHAPAGLTGTFGLEATPDAGLLRLHYWLAGLPAALEVDSFGLRFGQVDNMRAFLRSGYHSWDGSEYVPVETLAGPGPARHVPPGHALTQLLPAQAPGSLVIGFLRHDRFQHTFTFGPGEPGPALAVETLWDRQPHGGARCASETLVIYAHPEVEAALGRWAELCAAGAQPAPRPAGPPITGWCSWYNLYAAIDEATLLDSLQRTAAVARREQLPMRVFQIDDGFTPEMGDWLDFKPQFPRGVKPLLDAIRAAGFIPGLWIAPFLVGNRSRLFAAHPDWLVGDRQTGGPLTIMRFYGEFRWHKRSEEYYLLDTTHPAAFDYLRQVFHVWRHDWGCGYFKTDFMYYAAHYGPEQARWHAPGQTRIAIWRRVAEMIRAEIGDALWLGCGCPLWASTGLVDANRIGRDVGVEWQGERAAVSLLRDLPARSFANQVLWLADPDCVLLRERYHHLAEPELQALAIFAGMAGGVVMTSDDLSELSPERLRLWRLLLPAGRPAPGRFPFLGQPADPVLVQVRAGPGSDGQHAVFFFNTGPEPIERAFALADLGLPGPAWVWHWQPGQAWAAPVESLPVRLNAHQGALYFLSPQPWAQAPDTLG